MTGAMALLNQPENSHSASRTVIPRFRVTGSIMARPANAAADPPASRVRVAFGRRSGPLRPAARMRPPCGGRIALFAGGEGEGLSGPGIRCDIDNDSDKL